MMRWMDAGRGRTRRVSTCIDEYTEEDGVHAINVPNGTFGTSKPARASRAEKDCSRRRCRADVLNRRSHGGAPQWRWRLRARNAHQDRPSVLSVGLRGHDPTVTQSNGADYRLRNGAGTREEEGASHCPGNPPPEPARDGEENVHVTGEKNFSAQKDTPCRFAEVSYIMADAAWPLLEEVSPHHGAFWHGGSWTALLFPVPEPGRPAANTCLFPVQSFPRSAAAEDGRYDDDRVGRDFTCGRPLLDHIPDAPCAIEGFLARCIRHAVRSRMRCRGAWCRNTALLA